MLEGKVPAEAERRLRLVEDEQHAAILASTLDLLPIALRGHDDASCRLDRLGDQARERACRLRIDHGKADIDAGHVAGITAMLDRAAIGVRGREGEGAGGERAVAFAACDIVHRERARGHAVPSALEADRLEPAGVQLRHLQRSFVRLPAGGEEHRLRQGWRQHRSKSPRQLDNGGTEHSAEKMNGTIASLGNRFDDARMIVADGGAHLA